MTETLHTREKRPSAPKAIAFVLLLGIISAGLVVAALSRRTGPALVIPTSAPSALSVAVETVKLETSLGLEETFSGIVQPRRTSELGFSSGGRVASIDVDIGDRVTEGQRLARLDTRDLQANLAAAEASMAEAEADHELARATVERQRTLFERGHVSRQRVDEAEATAAASAARISAAAARADTLRVAIDLAAIRAPFAGTITNRMADEGTIAAPGMVFLELVETGTLEARIGLPAASVAELEPGGTYLLKSDLGPVEARLRSDTGVIDEGRRTVTTMFDIVDTASVPAGTVVRLELQRDISERGFWAPVSALTESRRGLWSIYVVEGSDDDWRVRPRLVEIVHSDADRVFVRGTLRNGERYVTGGLQRIVPDQKVMPVAAHSAARTSDEG